MSGSSPIVAVGTSGFSYADWVGPVYPAGTKPSAMLELYAQRFAVVEINATYYGVPKPSTFTAMVRRTPDGFRFAAKLPGTATHVPVEAAGTLHPDVEAFRASIDPLLSANRFAAALMQFPSSFRPSEATREHLAALRAALAGVPLVAEFRNRLWQTNETLQLLEALGIGFANVDEPHFKTTLRPSSDVTSAVGYVRFHGRNYQQWWKGDNATRFDYEYRPDELEPWVDRLVDIAAAPRVREVLAFFNNHRRGQAVRNAELFERMVETRLPGAIRRAGDAVEANAAPEANGTP